MPPRAKKQTAEDVPKASRGKGEKSLLTMELARAAARGNGQASSLEDIKALLQDRLLSLNKTAEASMNEEMDSVIANGTAGVVAKAKDHHVYISNELKISMDLQDQVKTEHERAVGDVRRMAAEAGQTIERDSELDSSVKRTKAAAQDEMKSLQRKYL